MTTVKPAVRSPRQTVDQIVSRFESEPVEVYDRRTVRSIISIFGGEEKQLGRRSHPNPAEADRNPAQPVALVKKNLPFVEPPVAAIPAPKAR